MYIISTNILIDEARDRLTPEINQESRTPKILKRDNTSGTNSSGQMKKFRNKFGELAFST